MRYLLCAAILLAACEKRGDTARDTTRMANETMAADTTAGPAPAQTMSAVPDRLVGTWTAKGFAVNTPEKPTTADRAAPPRN